MRRTAFIFLSILFFCTNCSKDFKLIDDYKETTIAYGLINTKDSITYIRIEKAFFTEGDIYESAQVADSNLFPYKLDVKIKTPNSEIVFDTVTIFNKKGGIFYAPKMLVYYAVTKGKLNHLEQVELIITNPKTKEITSSKTKVYTIDRLKVSLPTSSISFDEDFPEEMNVIINTVSYTRLYQIVMRLNYLEVDPNQPDNLVYKYADYNLAEVISRPGMVNKEFYINYDLVGFAAALSNNIPQTTVLERYYSQHLEIIINTANEDFLAYQQSTSSDYSIIMHRKTYNNIENGYGLFACRAIKSDFYKYDALAKRAIINIEGLNFKSSIDDYFSLEDE